MAKKLKVGDVVQEITLSPINGKEGDVKIPSGSTTVVVFSRYFGCPVCQADFQKLLDVKDKVMEKATLVYVTQSKVETAKEIIESRGVDFMVVSDPEKPYPVYKQFGVGKMSLGTVAKMLKYKEKGEYKHGAYEGSETQSPADFVIAADGKVLHANYSLLDVDSLLAALG